MKSSQIMIVAAIVMATAFAGIVLTDDEVNAEGVTSVSFEVFADGNPDTPIASVTRPISGDTFTVPTIEEIGLGEYGAGFEYWLDGAVRYTPGQVLDVSALMGEDGVLHLKYTYIEPTDVTFIVDGKETSATVSEGTITIPATIITDRAGYNFLGWVYSGSADDKLLSNEDVEALTGVKPGETFTAVYEPVYEVAWVVNGTTIATGSTEIVDGKATLGKPVNDPAQENYDFKGWAVDGKVVIAPGTAESAISYDIVEDTVFEAVFEAQLVKVTFMAGEQTVGVVEVRYGATVNALALPEGYASWDFDFTTPITEAITINAIEADPEPIEPVAVTVTFFIEGTPYGPYETSDRFSIPVTDRAGYNFLGWTVQGGDGTRLTNEQVQAYIADCSKSVVFTAVYEPIEVIEYIVTFMNGTSVVGTVKVVAGETVAEDAFEAPEGMFWNFDFATAINGDTTIYAAPEKVTVKFAVGNTVYEAYTQTIEYGGTVSAPTQFVFPAGYDGWNFDFSTPITEDITIYAAEIPAPVEEPGFFETTAGHVVLVLIGFFIIAFVGSYITNAFGVKTFVNKLLKRGD